MTVPTTNVSFSSIQTEFGGSNPISINEYYRGGAHVPLGVVTSPTDGSPIATSGTIRIGEFRGVANAFAANGIAFSSSSGVTDPPNTNTEAAFALSSNGTTTGEDTNTPWFTPTTTGIASSYWVMATLNSNTGTSPVGNFGTWNSCVGANWHKTQTGLGDSTSNITIQFSTSASGSPIVGTNTLTLNVEVSS